MGKKRAARRAAKKRTYGPGGYKDHYFQKAKKESYAARAVYKLEQIDKKYRLIRKGDRVLDLGCHPGSWMQYASKKAGQQGNIIGVDLTPTELQMPNVTTVTGDIFELDENSFAQGEHSFDVVLSDMAPNTTGIKTVDQLKSAALVEKALDIALRFCKRGGHFVAKIFVGPDEPKIYALMREHFAKVERYKPDASRSGSMENYLVGLGKKES